MVNMDDIISNLQVAQVGKETGDSRALSSPVSRPVEASKQIIVGKKQQAQVRESHSFSHVSVGYHHGPGGQGISGGTWERSFLGRQLSEGRGGLICGVR